MVGRSVDARGRVTPSSRRRSEPVRRYFLRLPGFVIRRLFVIAIYINYITINRIILNLICPRW